MLALLVELQLHLNLGVLPVELKLTHTIETSCWYFCQAQDLYVLTCSLLAYSCKISGSWNSVILYRVLVDVQPFHKAWGSYLCHTVICMLEWAFDKHCEEHPYCQGSRRLNRTQLYRLKFIAPKPAIWVHGHEQAHLRNLAYISACLVPGEHGIATCFLILHFLSAEHVPCLFIARKTQQCWTMCNVKSSQM